MSMSHRRWTGTGGRLLLLFAVANLAGISDGFRHRPAPSTWGPFRWSVFRREGQREPAGQERDSLREMVTPSILATLASSE